ncbi:MULTISPECIES: zinc-dependent metalloprotease [Arthrobacter]|uniref:Zinc-dependent metalloprotease n=2 Tax=Arthrobacter TaxID=1663 RepID=A0ABU9KK29_9MICC|nr:zinc-dependent metalloprotease [Arthrobacter sp. YJM1]MDP5227191.1 zinc-dependent metalloprotease [Arthrobacter sp. YJM1]
MSNEPNTNNPGENPQDPFQEMLKRLMGGQTPEGFDPQQFLKASGLPEDPQFLANMFQQVQAMLSSTSDGPVNWKLAHDTARNVAAQSSDPTPSTVQQRDTDQSLRLADMWLNKVTDFPEPNIIGKAWSRAEWVEATMPTWRRLTEPVANSIAKALTDAMTQNLPESFGGQGLGGMMGGAGSMLQNIGGAIFAMQLGQAIGSLSAEVVGSTEIGIPLADLEMALLPANVEAFGEGLQLPADDVRLYLSVREAAHARLFTSVPWLRGYVLGAIEDYARGIHIDVSRIQDMAHDVDPSNPESIQEALQQGVFMPERTPAQQAALDKLETALALIEGWVDVVTTQSLDGVLASAPALRETVRRRRATGGPAEHAFASLVGLELRPRRLREAATLWSTLTEERGAEGRDAVWKHPDLLPTAEDLDDPAGFGKRRELAEASDSEVDDAIAKLLAGGFDEPDDKTEDEGPKED